MESLCSNASESIYIYHILWAKANLANLIKSNDYLHTVQYIGVCLDVPL